ncbi:MAG: hypothetical protein KDC38_17890 [Planctomycetes bacterium]|nr:hypothetical protein [Planctomycetota bacterium]
MRPVGYNAKIIPERPDWLPEAGVDRILSVSECIATSPIDHFDLWLFNEWGFYDTPEILRCALARTPAGSEPIRRFYYEAHPEERDAEGWRPIATPNGAAAPWDASESTPYVLRGFDIVCFSQGNVAECSPLTCNSGAKHFPVNRDGLIESLSAALAAAEAMAVDGGYEPGPYRVMSVWEESGSLGGATSATNP